MGKRRRKTSRKSTGSVGSEKARNRSGAEGTPELARMVRDYPGVGEVVSHRAGELVCSDRGLASEHGAVFVDAGRLGVFLSGRGKKKPWAAPVSAPPEPLTPPAPLSRPTLRAHPGRGGRKAEEGEESSEGGRGRPSPWEGAEGGRGEGSGVRVPEEAEP